MRCYAPSTSVIAALLLVGYLTMRNAAGHALSDAGGAGMAAIIVIVLGCCLLAGGIAVVSAVTIRRRRAAAGGCLTCRHPCQEAVITRPGGQAAQGDRVASSGPSPWPAAPALDPGTSGRPGGQRDLPSPVWPDRPLTRAPLPVIVIPAQRPGARVREPARLSLPAGTCGR